jgi:hypothetical protein
MMTPGAMDKQDYQIFLCTLLAQRKLTERFQLGTDAALLMRPHGRGITVMVA